MLFPTYNIERIGLSLILTEMIDGTIHTLARFKSLKKMMIALGTFLERLSFSVTTINATENMKLIVAKI